MLSEDATEEMALKRAAVFFLLALCFMAAGVVAHADEPMSAVVAFTPADFKEPLTAKLSVTVRNSSDALIESVRIFDEAGKEGANIGTIEPGETLHFAYDYPVSQKMLDAGKVNFSFSYKVGAKTYKLASAAVVTQVENLAQATLTCRIFKSAVYSGENVQAEYRLFNTGSVAIENCVVSDAAFSYTSEPFSLAPGEEKCLTVVAPFNESAISAPRADFQSAESKNPYAVHAPSAAIHAASDNLSFVIEPETVSVAYGERAHFSITVKNNGLLTYTELSLAGDGLGQLPISTAALLPQESAVIQVETPPVTGNAAYPMRITLREAGGTERIFPIGEMKVSVVESPARNPILNVSANPEGDFPFTLTISGANRNLKNVKLSEKRLGEIKTFLTLEANSETVYTPSVSVNKGEAFEFSLSWEENGEAFSVSAMPAISRITHVKNTESDLTETTHASLYAMVNQSRFPKNALILCGALIFAVVAVFIPYHTVRVRKRRRQTRDAIGKTSKFAPVRTRETEKENP